MDIVDKLIALAQISGKVDLKCELEGKWSIEHTPQIGQGIAHIVTFGQGYLQVGNEGESYLVKKGDILFFPRSMAHRLNYHPEIIDGKTEWTHSQQGAFQLKKMGGQAVEFSLFCAHFYYAPHSELINCLPEMIVLQFEPIMFEGIVELLKNEATQPHIGNQSVVNALSSILFTFILREYLTQEDNQLIGLLKGWQDKRLKKLLDAIMASPEETWLIENMMEVAHLSRSQLIRLFKQHLGTSPHLFLHRIRLQKSAMLLKQTADSILKIALATGFQSETHFGKAFKKYYGMTPSQYRKMP